MNKKKIVDINVFKDLIKFYKIEYKKLYMLMFVVVISGILQAVVPLSIKLLTDDFITKQNFVLPTHSSVEKKFLTKL